MTLLRRFMSVLRRFVRPGRVEQELHDDIQGFIDASLAAKTREGIPEAEARRLAILELGGIEQAKERVRAYRHGARVEEVLRDTLYACRVFRRNPGFTVVVVLTLTLGIGANTAIFSLIDALTLRWLPVNAPQELARISIGSDDGVSASLSYPIVRVLAAQKEIFAGVAGFNTAVFEAGTSGSVATVPAAIVTGGYYETLGLKPVIGRLLQPADDELGARPVAVLSHGYWTRQFAQRGDVVGRTILLNGVPADIIGVSPRGFVGAEVGLIADVTVAVGVLPQLDPPAAPLLGPGNFWLRVLARPTAGLSMHDAESRLAAAWPRSVEPAIPPHWPLSRRQALAASTLRLSPGGTGWTFLRERYAAPLSVLMGVVAMVLVIACANVAGLLLARASSRQREIAVRLAMGAGRFRIVRQLLIESLLLSSFSAILGLGVAALATRVLVKMISDGRTPIAFDLSPNWHVLVFTMAVAIATAVVFGVAPAFQATAADPMPALRNDTRGSRRSSRLLPPLVSAEVALSFVLLVGAGLFGRTLHNLKTFDSGFNASGVLLVDLPAAAAGVAEDLVERVRRAAGVRSASFSTHTPLSGSTWSEPAVPAGQPIPDRDTALFVGAGTGFFETLQIPLKSGRSFTQHDTAESGAVAIVNGSYVRRFFPAAAPLGQHLSAVVRGQKKDLTIVGVAADVSSTGLRRPPPPTVYVPYAQLPPDSAPTLEIRAESPIDRVVPAVRQALQEALPGKAIEVRSLSAQVDATVLEERMMATLSAVFGVLALGLACIGLYGLLAYTVARRIREIGIRLALGATPGGVTGTVLKDAGRLIAIGVAVGLPAAWIASRWVESLLFGLKPRDPTAAAAAIVPLAAAALLAALIPARRAARVDPLVALRHE